MKNIKLLIVFTFFLFATFIAMGQDDCIGCGNVTNTGQYSSALGYQTVSTAHSSFASGMKSEANGNHAHALGFYAFSQVPQSYSIGSFIKANNYQSFVIGTGVSSGNDYHLVNDIQNSLMIGFGSTKPTLFVSESVPSTTFDKTGKVGIGNVTNLLAKLHIRADAGEEAMLYIH